MTTKIHEAIIYAGIRHSGQFRKGTQTPYLVHPMEVMGILIENNCSEEVIIAGILHDIIEDTCNDDSIRNEVRKVIAAKFGNKVLQIIDNESEDKSKSWKERKQKTITALLSDDLETKLVCCADKLSNMLSIKADKDEIGEKVFDRFNASKKDIEWYYRGVAENLNLDGFKMFSELNAVIADVFE